MKHRSLPDICVPLSIRIAVLCGWGLFLAAQAPPSIAADHPSPPRVEQAQHASVSPGPPFSLTDLGDGRVQLTWQNVPGWTYSTLVRVGPAGRQTLPDAQFVTSFADTIAPSEHGVCYAVLGSNASAGVFSSDTLCAVPRIASLGGPTNLSIRFVDETCTARLSWAAIPDATAYLLLPVGTQRAQLLPASVTSATDDTGGAFTCYIVAALSPLLQGRWALSDGVCGQTLGGQCGSSTIWLSPPRSPVEGQYALDETG